MYENPYKAPAPHPKPPQATDDPNRLKVQDVLAAAVAAAVILVIFYLMLRGLYSGLDEALSN